MTFENNWYLFENCIPVKGANRSIIYDLQRGSFKYIPNALYEIVKTKRIPSMDTLILEYGEENRETLQEYIQLLIDNEFIHHTTNKELFPEIELTYEKSGKIDNSILDYDNSSKYNLINVFDQLEGLGCKHVEIRFFDALPIDYVNEIVDALKDRIFSSVSIILKWDEKLVRQDYYDLLTRNARITNLVIHSSLILNVADNYHNRLLFIEDELLDSSCCGQISFQSFRVNIDMFTESKNFNNCLNKKISIDTHGTIKNCPSDNLGFGNIESKTLNEALLDKDFTKKWGVTKDKVSTCKDCEFRYMCSDCRIYIEDGEDLLSKPSKCNYNPYTSTWEESTSLLES